MLCRYNVLYVIRNSTDIFNVSVEVISFSDDLNVKLLITDAIYVRLYLCLSVWAHRNLVVFQFYDFGNNNNIILRRYIAVFQESHVILFLQMFVHNKRKCFKAYYASAFVNGYPKKFYYMM